MLGGRVAVANDAAAADDDDDDDGATGNVDDGVYEVKLDKLPMEVVLEYRMLDTFRSMTSGGRNEINVLVVHSKLIKGADVSMLISTLSWRNKSYCSRMAIVTPVRVGGMVGG